MHHEVQGVKGANWSGCHAVMVAVAAVAHSNLCPWYLALVVPFQAATGEFTL